MNQKNYDELVANLINIRSQIQLSLLTIDQAIEKIQQFDGNELLEKIHDSTTDGN